MMDFYIHLKISIEREQSKFTCFAEREKFGRSQYSEIVFKKTNKKVIIFTNIVKK